MKILLINHFPLDGSGSGVYTSTLANSLIKRNHEVAIIYPDNETKRLDIEDGIRLHPVMFETDEIPFNFPCFTTHPRSTFEFKNMTKEEKKTYEKAFGEKILEVIEDFKPDIIHSGHIWTLSGISTDIAKEYNIPLIITCHGTDLLGINDEKDNGENWGTKWANKAVQYADNIITISNDSNKLAKEIFKDYEDKFLTISNAINNDIFKYDENISKESVLTSLNIPIKDNIVCFAGKLTYIKGIDTLLKAAQTYENNNTLTIISGDGELREELEDFVNNNSIENISFIGNQPQSILSSIYNVSDCLVVPSRKEAFGLVAVEAMACGIPVIATNQGGLKELIDEDVGLTFEIDDYDTLANYINRIINKEISFSKDKIIEKVDNYYSQDRLIDEVEKIYTKSLNKDKNKVR